MVKVHTIEPFLVHKIIGLEWSKLVKEVKGCPGQSKWGPQVGACMTGEIWAAYAIGCSTAGQWPLCTVVHLPLVVTSLWLVACIEKGADGSVV